MEPVLGPRWPRLVRLGLALFVVSLGYVCYRFRLTSASSFAAIGGGIIEVIVIARAVLWWWQQRRASVAKV